MLPQGLEVLLDIRQQGGKGRPLMIMGDFASRPAPEPCDPIGLRGIRGCVDKPQMVVQLEQHLTHQARSCGGMGAEVINHHDGSPAPGTRPSDGGAYLGTKDICRAAGGQAPLKPAITPVHEPEAIHLVVGSGRLDEALPASAFAAPHAGEGRMERDLDLVLERDIGTGQEVGQLVHIGWHFSEQVRLDQRRDGWRGGRASPGQDHLHPQAFPT